MFFKHLYWNIYCLQEKPKSLAPSWWILKKWKYRSGHHQVKMQNKTGISDGFSVSPSNHIPHLLPKLTTNLTSHHKDLEIYISRKYCLMASFFCPRLYCCLSIFSTSAIMVWMSNSLMTNAVSQLFMFIGYVGIFISEWLFLRFSFPIFFIISLFYWFLEVVFIFKIKSWNIKYLLSLRVLPCTFIFSLLIISKFISVQFTKLFL